MNRKANYGNWVPANMLVLSYLVTVIFLIAALLSLEFIHDNSITRMLVILCLITCCYTIYMHKCRNTFAFEKGGLMGKVHEYLLEHLNWNGKGKILDIGCGAGALTIRSAKKYPDAKLTGIDYWGMEWNYAKEQCECNASAEGVAEQIHFQQGDAAKLDFADETFDAVVSNFVFHEVKSVKDKREVVREALRVVKKGGAFAFQDLFSQRSLYGDMERFIEQLKKEGITDIHYIPLVEKQVDFIPKYITMPWMLHGVGIIYGMK